MKMNISRFDLDFWKIPKKVEVRLIICVIFLQCTVINLFGGFQFPSVLKWKMIEKLTGFAVKLQSNLP